MTRLQQQQHQQHQQWAHHDVVASLPLDVASLDVLPGDAVMLSSLRLVLGPQLLVEGVLQLKAVGVVVARVEQRRQTAHWRQVVMQKP